jgi:hypothetical protein
VTTTATTTLARLGAVALCASAAAAPAASAKPADPVLPASTPAHVTTSPIVIEQKATDDFDWGDAGIGAAAGVGLGMIVLAGSTGLARRRRSVTGRVDATSRTV